MAGTISSNSYLPGQTLKPVEGMVCDNHPDRLSVFRMVGETDSFGSELHDFCQECYDKAVEYNNTPREQICDWCGAVKNDCKPMRDPEEGSYGPMYTVCRSCAKSKMDYFLGNEDG